MPAEDLPLVDCHIHLRDPEGIEPHLQIMDTCGMEAVNALSLSAAGREGSPLQNLLGLIFKAQRPEQIYFFGGLEYSETTPRTTPGPAEQAERLIALGADGIKMIEGKPQVYRNIDYTLDDPYYDEFYGYLESEEIPLLLHVADPATFWDPERVPEFARRRGWFYGEGDYPDKEELYSEVERVVDRFPQLRVILAHFYFLSEERDRAAEILERWPNVSFDLTPGTEMYFDFSRDPEGWRDFFLQYQEQILFGTDNSGAADDTQQAVEEGQNKVATMRRFLETKDAFAAWRGELSGLGLEREALEKIYASNFQSYAGKTPRPLKLERVRKEYTNLRKQPAQSNDELSAALAKLGAKLEEL